MKVKIVNKTEFELPTYKTEGSVGMDLRANLKTQKPKDDKDVDPFKEEDWEEEYEVTLEPRKQELIPTGIFIQLPHYFEKSSQQGWGYEAQIRPRSGLAAKYGITVVNAPGTIDCDFIGEIKVILMNLTDKPYTIKHGERIAQMVISRFETISWLEVEKLDDTIRNSGGFGSTGK